MEKTSKIKSFLAKSIVFFSAFSEKSAHLSLQKEVQHMVFLKEKQYFMN